MRTLAIETATEACSLALFDGAELVASQHRVLGRGHAEHLVPMIAALPGRGRAERVLVSLGPGSFTGVRIGIAAARALGVAWGAEVLGYPTLALTALTGLEASGADAIGVAMTGGHGEWFVQRFDGSATPIGPHASLAPADAAQAIRDEFVAGTRATELVAERGSGTAIDCRPDARHVLAIPRQLLAREPAAIYGRPPDARLPA